MFNKDPEKIKNRQSVMNDTITEIKSPLKGTINKITEVKERISEMEDRMLEITEAEQNKEKRRKRKRTVSEISRKTLGVPTFGL